MSIQTTIVGAFISLIMINGGPAIYHSNHNYIINYSSSNNKEFFHLYVFCGHDDNQIKNLRLITINQLCRTTSCVNFWLIY